MINKLTLDKPCRHCGQRGHLEEKCWYRPAEGSTIAATFGSSVVSRYVFKETNFVIRWPHISVPPQQVGGMYSLSRKWTLASTEVTQAELIFAEPHGQSSGEWNELQPNFAAKREPGNWRVLKQDEESNIAVSIYSKHGKRHHDTYNTCDACRNSRSRSR